MNPQLSLLIYLLLTECEICFGNRILTTDKKKPVLGQPLVFIYTDSEEDIRGGVIFKLNGVTQGGCASPGGQCGSGLNHNVTRQSTRVITLEISSFNETKHAGTWNVIETYQNIVNSLNLTLTAPFATVVETSKIDFTEACSNQTDIDSQTDFTVSVTTGCAYPAVNISWNFVDETSVSLTPVTTAVSDGCTSPQVKTVARLTMNYLTVQGKVNVTTHLIHPSFNNDVYDKFICTAHFPVQVTEVTLLNISSQKDKIQVSEGFVSLTCVTSPSNPVSSVYWYKNNQQINTGITNINITSRDLTVRKSSLSLTLTESDDGHSVYCKAGIPGQTLVTSNTGILDVSYGPSLNDVNVSYTDEQIAVEGRPLTLTCRTLTAVKPDVDFVWMFKDGTDVNGSQGEKKGSSGNTWSQTLTLTPSREQNGKTILCTVRNTHTQTESTGEKFLDVKYPPSSPPVVSGTTFPVFEGDTVTLNCFTTGGNPKPNLNWTCYNPVHCSDREETRTCTIRFIANRTQANKVCECVSSWKYGDYNERKSRNLTIHYPPSRPTLSSDPKQPWLENTGGSLICSLPDSGKGNPAAQFYWIRNGTNIQHTGFNLSLTPTKEDNGVWYKCSAGNKFTDRNGQQRPESEKKQLNIYYYPRIKVTFSKSGLYKEGDNLTLTCTSDSNPSPAELKWTFGGQELVNNGKLILTNLNRTNQGNYTCEANVTNNKYTNLFQSHDTEVVVNYSPDIAFDSLNTTENITANITCFAQGRPGNMKFTSFKHYWNGVFIEDVSGVVVGNSQYRLMFKSATYEDGGTYTCSVQNGITDRFGKLSQTKSADIYVKATPKITMESKADSILGAEIGKPVRLIKTIFSNPNFTTFAWSNFDKQTHYNNTEVVQENVTLQIHNKTVTDSGYTFSLSISNFTQNNIGVYKLTVCNEVGCSQFSVNLTGAGPPLPPKEFQQERESTSDTVFLSWLPNYPGGNFKQRFILQYKPQSDSNWITWTSKWYDDSTQGQKVFYNISSLKDKTVYDVRIAAENTRIQDNMSNYVTFQVITEALRDQSGSSPVLGAAVGGAVGSVTIIVVIVTLIVLLRRRFLPCLSTKKSEDAENALHTASNAECVLPVLEDNDLYFKSDEKKPLKLPVLEDNDLYYTSKDNFNKSKPSGNDSRQVDPKPSTSSGVTAENPESQYSVVKKTKTSQSTANQSKEGEKDKTESAKEKKKKEKQQKKLKKKQKENKKKEKGDVYENVDAKDECIYANAAFEGEGAAGQNVQGAKHGRDEDGLLYVGIDFSNTQPSKHVHKTQDKVEYVSIDWNKKAEPLPDEDEKQTEPKSEK